MRIRQRAFLLFLIALALISSASLAMADTFQVLHTFDGDAGEGFASRGALTLSGSKLYGTTTNGGALDSGRGGTVYSVNLDGSGFQVLHSFDFQPGNNVAFLSSTGESPAAGVTIVGSKVYGTTAFGGASSFGSVYSMNLDGSGYQVLRSFSNAGGSNSLPLSTLQSDGSKLYGTTSTGSSVFSMNLDGSGFQTIHLLSGTSSSGLTLVGSKLYGTTEGSSQSVYSVNVDGSAFTVLHTFGSVLNDGFGPRAGLTQIDSMLYGTTRVGGDFGAGTVYALNLDGSGYQLLHSFSSAGARIPGTELTQVGDRLYGTTEVYGDSEGGAVFSMKLDGSDFRDVYVFHRGPHDDENGDPVPNFDGTMPWASLTLVGSTLYGTTVAGGTGGGFFPDQSLGGGGTLYAINVPEPSTFVLAGLAAIGAVTARVRRRAIRSRNRPPRLR